MVFTWPASIMADNEGEVTTEATNYESDERIMDKKDALDSKLNIFKHESCFV